MNNFYIVKNDELYHFGVKGMKWGVRRKREKIDKTKTNLLTLKAKTKKGKTLTASQLKTPKIASFLAKYSINLRKQIEATRNMDLYDDEGNKIGNLQLFHESEKSVNVTWIGIDEKYRGSGYATTAMKMAIDYSRKSGAKQMTLEVPGISPDARHIYEKMGFKDTGESMLGDTDDVWGGLTRMKLDL